MNGARLAVTLAVALALSAHGGRADAAPDDDARARAAQAYKRGVAATDRGDHREAAKEFALADATAPNPVALRAALDAAVDADEPVLGSELVARASRAPVEGLLAKSVEAAKKKFAGRAGRLEVVCPERATCLATLDGSAIKVGAPTWTRSGQHTVVVQLDGVAQTKLVEVGPDEVATVTPAPVAASVAPPGPATPGSPSVPPPSFPPLPPASEPEPSSPSRTGLWITGGLTVAVGAFAGVFAFRAKTAHDDFVSADCPRVPHSSCEELKVDGEDTQRTANILFGITGALAVGTGVVALFFTDWGGPKKKAGSAAFVAPTTGGATLGWSGRF